MNVTTVWQDRKPSQRCDWIDQLRGWAVIVMIEVHCVNVWLHQGMIPDWLNYVNGLVAPSFIMCAGYSLALSTFRTDGTLRPFAPTAKRLAFILLCAYALHFPGWSLAEWTVLSTPQKFREFFKIDVLQCIVFSLLILQGLARLIRKPMAYAACALGLAIGAALAAPHLWKPGMADGWWLPIRGIINGNTDRGVTALFPLFPWLAFAAFGSVFGVLYRQMRVLAENGRSRWSELKWLAMLSMLGVVLLVLSIGLSGSSLGDGPISPSDLTRLHNTTLASVIQRLGVVSLAGSAFGAVDLWRRSWPGPNWVDAASRESLLVYMLHLNLIFGVLLAEPVRAFTGWEWYSMGWQGTLSITAVVIAANLAAAVTWQKIRQDGHLALKLQRAGLALLGVWFVAGGWLKYESLSRSPELAKEPYAFLNEARIRKGLQPTSDGLSHDPLEIAKEKIRRGRKLSVEEKRLLDSKGG